MPRLGIFLPEVTILTYFRGETSLEGDSIQESKIFRLPVLFTYAKPPSRFGATMGIDVPSQSSLGVSWLGHQSLNE
jgi:hypothetical protein